MRRCPTYWIGLIFTLSFATAGCDNFVHVSGFVRDPDGVPLGHALVRVADLDLLGIESRADGCFEVVAATDPWHSRVPVTVEVPGFKTAITRLRRGMAGNRVVVTMLPDDSASASHVHLLAGADTVELAVCSQSK